MGGLSGALHGNLFVKVAFSVGAIILAFAPPTVRADGAAEAIADFQFCHGYFALCAASTCTLSANRRAAPISTSVSTAAPPPS